MESERGGTERVGEEGVKIRIGSGEGKLNVSIRTVYGK